ncbi:MAG: DUF222 domain-containing protein [Marmoricola sp.]
MTLQLESPRGVVNDGGPVAELEALRSTLDAVELEVVRELEATSAVKPEGWASTQDYVTAVAGGHKDTGPGMVRLAKAVTEPVLTPVGAALIGGWLSAAKARVIERAIDALPGDAGLRARGVAVLLEQARIFDATDLRKLSRRLVSILDPEGDERRDERALDRLERAAHVTRGLSVTDDQAGGAWIRGRCSIEDAVLVEGCRRLQTADLLPRSHGAAPRLTLTMALPDLQQLSGFAMTETGEQLSASAVRRLCCEAEVIPAVLGARSEVLDVGRLQRLVTNAIWRALVVRDQHCRFPHCTRPPLMTHAHHVTHWIDGGATSLSNLILLCGHHHRLVHAAPWTIRRTSPNDFVFEPPPGASSEISAPPRPPPRE